MWGYQRIVIGAVFLKVLHPAAYTRLRAEQLTLEVIEELLSLARPQAGVDATFVDMNWAVWAYVFKGNAGLEDLNVNQAEIAAVNSGLNSRAVFGWRNAHRIFDEMLDSFSLPAP